MSWRAVHGFVVKEVKLAFRDKQELFWTILFPIFMMLLTAYVFVPQSPTSIPLSLGVVNEDSSTAYGVNSTVLIKAINSSKVFSSVKLCDNATAALSLLRRGKLDAVLVIPQGFARNLTCSTARVYVYVLSGVDKQKEMITLNVLRGFFQHFSKRVAVKRVEAALRNMPASARSRLAGYLYGLVEPVNVTYSEVKPESVNTRSKIIGWFALGMVGITLMFQGFGIGASMIVEEKEKGTLRRILAAPLSEWDILAGKTAAVLVVDAISAAVTLAFSVFALRATISFSSPMSCAVVAALLALGALFSVSLGLILSAVSKTVRGAWGLASALGWPLMFLTGVWLPRWMLPEPLRVLADVFPLTWAIDGARSVVVYGANPLSVAAPLARLAGVTIVVFCIGAAVYRTRLSKMLEY